MNYDVANIDGKLCTHIIYAFVGISDKTYTLEALDPEYDFVRGKLVPIYRATFSQD
jgi:chitinase, putative